MTPDWFGTATPGEQEHVVPDGRWAYTPVMQDARGWSNITNPYGLLRSPWNTNPTPFVTRCNYVYGVKNGNFSLPTCHDFLCTFAKANRMGVIQQMVNGLLHGPIHIMSGGLWSVDPEIFAAAETMAERSSLNNFLLTSKFMWRQGFIKCPEVCDRGTPAIDCLCTTNPGIVNLTATEIMEKSGVYGLYTELSAVMSALNLTDSEVLRVFAHFGHAGEMFTSAAPYDPLFWPLHGMAERYVQAIRYYIERGLIDISTEWSYWHAHNLISDTQVVCDWSQVPAGSLAMPNCTFGQACPGHRADDLLPFENILINTDLSLYTNAEFYAKTGPFSEHVTYVYDQMTNWTQCGNLLDASTKLVAEGKCDAWLDDDGV